MPNTFKNFAQKNVGTSLTTVYTCPSATQTTIIGLTVANTSNATVVVDAVLTISGVDYYIIKGAVVPVGTSVVPVGGDQKVVVEAGETIRVASSAATSADVIVSVLEIS
jgi:hypothetical protein